MIVTQDAIFVETCKEIDVAEPVSVSLDDWDAPVAPGFSSDDGGRPADGQSLSGQAV